MSHLPFINALKMSDKIGFVLHFLPFLQLQEVHMLFLLESARSDRWRRTIARLS
jgi:hypothetical protein